MDYDSASDSFFVASMVSNHPVISIACAILCAVFAAKSCAAGEECANQNCATGQPLMVKGQCICTETPKP